MLSQEMINRFLNKFVWIMYKDSNESVSAKGTITDVTLTEIALETEFNVILIPLTAIEKVKISKTEL